MITHKQGKNKQRLHIVSYFWNVEESNCLATPIIDDVNSTCKASTPWSPKWNPMSKTQATRHCRLIMTYMSRSVRKVVSL